MPNKIFLALAIAWTALITVLCLVSMEAMPGIQMPESDKTIHGLLYFFFTLFWYGYFRGNLSELEISRVLLFVFLVSGLYGVMIELAQAFFTETRQADINDVFANLTGSFIAVSILYILGKYREKQQSTK